MKYELINSPTLRLLLVLKQKYENAYHHNEFSTLTTLTCPSSKSLSEYKTYNFQINLTN